MGSLRRAEGSTVSPLPRKVEMRNLIEALRASSELGRHEDHVAVGVDEYHALMDALDDENALCGMKEEILSRIDKAKLSVLRGMHSGDKVADTLTALVEKTRELEDTYIWKCPECGAECVWDAAQAGDGGTPMCVKCDIDMEPDRLALFDTEEWKDAEAYVLRITQIRDSKEEKKDG